MRDVQRGDQIRFEANRAIQAQLATLPPIDQARTQRALMRLVENPDSAKPVRKKLRQGHDLWEVEISPELRALVRIADEKVTVLAIARHDELVSYRLDH
jgi:hypothetical protein